MSSRSVAFFEALKGRLADTELISINGKVSNVTGIIIESIGPDIQIGDLCEIRFRKKGKAPLKCEVVGFRDDRILLMPLGDLEKIGPGCSVFSTGKPMGVPVGEGLLGRVLNGLGEPIDEKGSLDTKEFYPLQNDPPHPLKRKPVKDVLSVGVRAIDGVLTIGQGQRIGIFSGSGVGKSTMLGMMARYTEADVNVIVLVGERGREVQEFLNRDLKEEGMRRSVIVVATSDQPPLIRLKAALTGTAIAEYFRDIGKNVLLMMDSITRVAMAQRDVGLAVGEPPVTRGYTPSVFTFLPRLLERAGNSDKGSITGIYTVLVEGDDLNEPVADTVRGILDGHIVLSRNLAMRNHYPAVDILQSISRLMKDITSVEQQEAARSLRENLSLYYEAEELINLGAYKEGSNAKLDFAVQNKDKFDAFLKQDIEEYSSFEETLEKLLALPVWGGDLH
ncbi:flagellar protein export ATPase FliI [Thermovirga sp.]|uniref:flagellar protein export ATPase FliI n=1 Tax=Thermovirga sp. TaxID=2699834 RepID=UPI0025EC448E|nr:flagellar protein export ATPase FliI [Thermovirga sp.]MBO8154430.1 flagellar protein export ATPase FliI [Thermovirga sp.]